MPSPISYVKNVVRPSVPTTATLHDLIRGLIENPCRAAAWSQSRISDINRNVYAAETTIGCTRVTNETNKYRNARRANNIRTYIYTYYNYVVVTRTQKTWVGPGAY